MSIDPRFQRLSLLTGIETAEAISKTHAAVFGLGGVGSWCAEALVRSGIGGLVIVDFDRVCVSNINRQVEATSRTIGKNKTEVLAERLAEINPSCEIKIITEMFARRGTLEETAAAFDIDKADYVIDAIDTIGSKLDLVETTATAGKILFSSMGMAKKTNPTLLRTADIWKTSGCPLARHVREGLRKRGFEGHFPAVYSAEAPCQTRFIQEQGESETHNEDETENVKNNFNRKIINGSLVTVTATAGMILASLVLNDISARFGGGQK